MDIVPGAAARGWDVRRAVTPLADPGPTKKRGEGFWPSPLHFCLASRVLLISFLASIFPALGFDLYGLRGFDHDSRHISVNPDHFPRLILPPVLFRGKKIKGHDDDRLDGVNPHWETSR